MTDATTKRPSRKGLYAPFILVLIALAAWTGWWVFLTRQIDTRLEAQVQTLRQDGWDVRFAGKTIGALESRAGQLHLFDRLPEASQQRLLLEARVTEQRLQHPGQQLAQATELLIPMACVSGNQNTEKP